MSFSIHLRSPKRPLDGRFVIEKVYTDKNGLPYDAPVVRMHGDYEGDAVDFQELLQKIKQVFLYKESNTNDDNSDPAADLTSL